MPEIILAAIDQKRSSFKTPLTYRVFSRDVTAAMLVSLNKGKAAMLVSPINPPGIEFYSYANVSFCFGWKTCSLATWVKTLYRWLTRFRSMLSSAFQSPELRFRLRFHDQSLTFKYIEMGLRSFEIETIKKIRKFEFARHINGGLASEKLKTRSGKLKTR